MLKSTRLAISVCLQAQHSTHACPRGGGRVGRTTVVHVGRAGAGCVVLLVPARRVLLLCRQRRRVRRRSLRGTGIGTVVIFGSCDSLSRTLPHQNNPNLNPNTVKLHCHEEC